MIEVQGIEKRFTEEEDDIEHNYKKASLGGRMGPAKREMKGAGTDRRWI